MGQQGEWEDQPAGKGHHQPEKLAANKEGEELQYISPLGRVRSPCIAQIGQAGIFKSPEDLIYFINKIIL